MKLITYEEAKDQYSTKHDNIHFAYMDGYNAVVERHNSKKKKQKDKPVFEFLSQIIDRLEKDIKNLRIEEENGYNDLNKRVDELNTKIESLRYDHNIIVARFNMLEPTVQTNAELCATLLHEITQLKESLWETDYFTVELRSNQDELNKKINEVRKQLKSE